VPQVPPSPGICAVEEILLIPTPGEAALVRVDLPDFRRPDPSAAISNQPGLLSRFTSPRRGTRAPSGDTQRQEAEFHCDRLNAPGREDPHADRTGLALVGKLAAGILFRSISKVGGKSGKRLDRARSPARIQDSIRKAYRGTTRLSVAALQSGRRASAINRFAAVLAKFRRQSAVGGSDSD